MRSIRDDGSRSIVVLDAAPAGARAQRWELTLASFEDDLTRMPLEHAALVPRANLEEWWDTRDQYPDGMPEVAERRVQP